MAFPRPQRPNHDQTVSAYDREARARPVGAKHPPPAGRALAGGFGPPAQTRKRCRMTEAMASAIPPSLPRQTRYTPPMARRKLIPDAAVFTEIHRLLAEGGERAG